MSSADGTPVYQPTVINFNPGIFFDTAGVVDYYQGPTSGFPTGDSAYTIRSVALSNNVSTSPFIIAGGAVGANTETALYINNSSVLTDYWNGNNLVGGTVTLGLPYIFGSAYAALSSGNIDRFLYQNGSLLASKNETAIHATSTTATTIGAETDGTNGFNGTISEVFTYNIHLSTGDQLKIDSYLAIKYGVTLSGGGSDYLDSASNIIWNTGINSGYTNNITII